jgi:PEP-CTERM motif
VKLRSGLGVAALVLLVAPLRAQYSQSLGDFNGPDNESGYPYLYDVGTFTGIPDAASISSATIYGTWGTDALSTSTAALTLFLNGIQVAQCVYDDPGCWQDGDPFRPWSYTFSPGEFATLAGTGSADLVVRQDDCCAIRLGNPTLEITETPEPGSMVLLASGLAFLGVHRRKRRFRRLAS